jgi:NADH dehydrogenase FAD-containing subunit
MTAKRSLEQLCVEVRLEAGVTKCDCSGVSMGAERIEARTIIWAAGVMASPAGEWLGAETDRAGRVKVGPDLSLPGHPEVFVLHSPFGDSIDSGKCQKFSYCAIARPSHLAPVGASFDIARLIVFMIL